MKFLQRNWKIAVGIVTTAIVLFGGYTLLFNFEQADPAEPFSADGVCPVFEASYPQCEIIFGNSGLSVVNSFYETFVGEGAFEIDGFTVDTRSETEFLIVGDSNRGPLTSEIVADRVVRLGQDRENEILFRSHQSSYCDAGRIYEHQVVYTNRGRNIQDLEYWTEGDEFNFKLFQGGSLTARVVCQP